MQDVYGAICFEGKVVESTTGSGSKRFRMQYSLGARSSKCKMLGEQDESDAILTGRKMPKMLIFPQSPRCSRRKRNKTQDDRMFRTLRDD
jgi:hypothetical protein